MRNPKAPNPSPAPGEDGAPAQSTGKVLESVTLRSMPGPENAGPEAGMGKRVRYARNDLGLSVEGLARLSREYDSFGSGLSPTSISRYETGESLPGLREFRLLCEALDVPLTWLLYGDPTEPNGVQLTSGEALVVGGIRQMFAEQNADSTLEVPAETAQLRRMEIRMMKLTRARKPST